MSAIKQKSVTSPRHGKNLRNYINDKDALLRDGQNLSIDQNWFREMRLTRETYGLSRDAREARNASRALDDSTSGENSVIAASLGRIEGLVAEQKESTDKMLGRIDKAVQKAEEAATKINKVSTFLSNDQYAMQDTIQAGTTEAIKEIRCLHDPPPFPLSRYGDS